MVLPSPDILLALREDALSQLSDEVVAVRIATLNGGLLSGAVPPDVWVDAMLGTLRRAHIESYALGAGGIGNLTQSDYGRIGAFLRREYEFMRNMIDGVNAGSITEGQLATRLGMYANHVQQTFWGGSRSLAGAEGATEESRHLNPGESCDDCTGYEAEGWQPIGHFPPPGNRSVCLANCNCSMAFR